jgi:hypothetical protein
MGFLDQKNVDFREVWVTSQSLILWISATDLTAAPRGGRTRNLEITLR